MPVFGMLGIRKIKIRCSCFSLKFEKNPDDSVQSSRLGLSPKTFYDYFSDGMPYQYSDHNISSKPVWG